MNLAEQFIYYFKENGSYVLASIFTPLLNFDLWSTLSSDCSYSIRDFNRSTYKLADWVIRIANVIQTVPQLAMIQFNDWYGAWCECRDCNCFFVFHLPIIKNTYTGMSQVDRNALDVGTGMGMTPLATALYD